MLGLEVNLGQSGTVTFTYGSPEADTPPSNNSALLQDETTDHKFRLLIPGDKITAIQYDRFSFPAYIKDLRHSGAASYRVNVVATPKGNFADTRETLKFKIGKSEGTIEQFPVHPPSRPDLLTFAAAQQTPVEVHLSGVPNVFGNIKSSLSALDVIISKSWFEWDCSDCWRTVTLEVDGRPVNSTVVGKGAELPVRIVAQPNTLSALLVSALTIRPKEPHDTLRLHLTYAPDQGGKERTQVFYIPVRFTPNFWILITAVLLGSTLGLLLKALLRTQGSMRAVLVSKDTAVAILLAFVGEVLAIILMAPEGSSIVILGVNLDPRQALPCVLLALLISGGPTVKTTLQGLVKSWTASS